MITSPSFGNYYKIKCADYIQAKKLMAEMQASLRNADVVKGSKNNEVIISGLQDKLEMDKAFQCLKKSVESKPINLTTSQVIDLYKSHTLQPKQPKSEVKNPKIDIKL